MRLINNFSFEPSGKGRARRWEIWQGRQFLSSIQMLSSHWPMSPFNRVGWRRRHSRIDEMLVIVQHSPQIKRAVIKACIVHYLFRRCSHTVWWILRKCILLLDNAGTGPAGWVPRWGRGRLTQVNTILYGLDISLRELQSYNRRKDIG